MPFPENMPGYRTQFEDRSDAPRYGVRPCGWGLAAVLGVPVAGALGLLVWGTWALVGWLIF